MLAHHLCHLCDPGRWGAAGGFGAAFRQSTHRPRRLYLVDDDAIFHPLAHPSASIAGAAHPGAALSRRLAQFCGRSFGKRCTEPAGELPLWRLYLRYDHLRRLRPDLDHRSGRHP